MSARRPTSARPSSRQRSSPSEKSSNNHDPQLVMECKAAYLMVLAGVDETLDSKEQLRKALQNSGRNPSQKMINKYWTKDTDEITFDEFVSICRKIPLTSKDELMKAFRRIDINGDGYISNSELLKVMTTRGERMSPKEVQQIIDEVDDNKDGKLDYKEFCKMMLSTQDACLKKAKEHLDRKDKRPDASPHSHRKSLSQGGTPPKPVPRRSLVPRKSDNSSDDDDAKSSPGKGKGRSMSPVSSKRQALAEPKKLKSWNQVASRGVFFVEEDGSIASHLYSLSIPQDTQVWLTISPYTPGSGAGSRGSDQPPVDTRLFVVKDQPDNDEPPLLAFTEHRDSKGKYCASCELSKGRYVILPFTSGCRLKQRRTEPKVETKLVKKDKDDKYVLTTAFKEALGDIFEMCDLDGNGLMSRAEFGWFNFRTSGEEMADEEWEVVEDNVELKNHELTRQGFLELNQMEADDNQGDTDDLWVTLTCMGYNKGLVMDEACPFQMEVYTERGEAKLRVTDVAISKQIQGAVLQTLYLKGESGKIGTHKDIILYSHLGPFGATLAIENKSRSPVTVEVDCSKSKNVISSQGHLKQDVNIRGKTTVVAHHLLPDNEDREWSIHHTESVIK